MIPISLPYVGNQKLFGEWVQLYINYLENSAGNECQEYYDP